MANKSNWKGTEKLAALMFPGGKRRTRIGGSTYALVADDVIWAFPEKQIIRKKLVPVKSGKRKGTNVLIEQPAIIKQPLLTGVSPVYPVYIECKKRGAADRTTTFFMESEEKYCHTSDDKLVLVTHVKGAKKLLVTVSDKFFKELILAWAEKRGIV